MTPGDPQDSVPPELLAEIRKDAEWRAWVKSTLEELARRWTRFEAAHEGDQGVLARLARAEAATERTAEKLRWVVAILAAVSLVVLGEALGWVFQR